MQDNIGSKARIKICFVITKGGWGGASNYLYTLAVNLPKDRYNVSVITGAGSVLKNKLEENSIKVYEIKTLKRDVSVIGEIRSFITLFKIIKKEKPQILHLNSPKASGLGSVAGRLNGVKKIIQTVHGWSFNEDRNKISRSLIYFFSWITVMLCNKTIVIAKNEELQALEMPLVRKNKISFIQNGVLQIKFKEKEVARKDLLLRSGKIDVGNVLWIGTIAELHKNKGLDYAILAISKIKTPCVYFIIGEGEERERLEKIIAENNLEDQVFLPGFMEEANLNLKAFDIFVLPSIKEGLPYTILEAGLAGLPVVATSVGGIKDIISDISVGVIKNKGKVNEITQGLEYIINLKEHKVKIGENLKDKIEKDFSFSRMLEETLKIYS